MEIYHLLILSIFCRFYRIKLLFMFCKINYWWFYNGGGNQRRRVDGVYPHITGTSLPDWQKLPSRHSSRILQEIHYLKECRRYRNMGDSVISPDSWSKPAALFSNSFSWLICSHFLTSFLSSFFSFLFLFAFFLCCIYCKLHFVIV